MPATARSRGQRSIEVDGQTVRLSNPGKVMYPETGTTKNDVAEYYIRAAPALIPWASARPATRKRWVDGVGTAADPGGSFFQKDLDASTPEWIRRRRQHHKDHDNDYPLVNDVATLVWFAQQAALEIHVPQWRFDSAGEPSNPDRLVFDLDPGDGMGLKDCACVAGLVRAALADRGLESLPVTSGSKGIHIYAAIDGKRTSQEAVALAHGLAQAMEHRHGDLVTSMMDKSLRRGRIFIDWSQNSPAKTTVVPYSLRGRAHPNVAAPRYWDEIASPDLAQLDYLQVLRRIDDGRIPRLPPAISR